MVRVFLLLISIVAAVVSAQSTNENGPLFNPSEAPFFGPSGLVDPTVIPIPTLTDDVPTFTQTPTFIRSRTSSGLSPTVTSTASESTVSSHSGSVSRSRSLTTGAASHSSSVASASASAQSTAAAVVNGHNLVGMVAGGVVAGLALL